MSLSRYPLHADALGPFKTAYLALLESIQKTFGIDPVLIIEGALGLTAAATFIRYGASYIYGWAQQFFISSVHIGEEDQLYGHLMRWITDKHLSKRAFRSVRASTRHQADIGLMPRARLRPMNMMLPPIGSSIESEEDSAAFSIDEDFDPERLSNHRIIAGRMPVVLQPFQSSQFFRHQGSWIYFSHGTRHEPSNAFREAHQSSHIRLQCLGWSLQPIETLLWDAQTYYLENSKSMTTVNRASAYRGMHPEWSQIISRPSRDIRTVFLNKEKKHALLKDINEYLHPRTRRWYANHGIPYRRGYLFSGAPGTGKTSLTSAIAGIFSLPIYVLSLLDPQMNESGLTTLMSQVPSRCILLIEDVDAAGISQKREQTDATAAVAAVPQPVPILPGPYPPMSQPAPPQSASPNILPPGAPSTPSASQGMHNDPSKAPRATPSTAPPSLPNAAPSSQPANIQPPMSQAVPPPMPPPQLMYLPERKSRRQMQQANGISLSALLNAIDGVASQEGRVLIMTTNAPETLDDALVRPGRIDMHVHFDLPSWVEIRELFLSMYSEIVEKSCDGVQEVKGTEKQKSEMEPVPAANSKAEESKSFSTQQMQEMANRFAEALPEGKFNLAEIQGFMLGYKRDPAKACERIGAWVKERGKGDDKTILLDEKRMPQDDAVIVVDDEGNDSKNEERKQKVEKNGRTNKEQQDLKEVIVNHQEEKQQVTANGLPDSVAAPE